MNRIEVNCITGEVSEIVMTQEELDALPVVATPTFAEVVSVYNNAVQAHLDSFAASWRYVSILSAASYANSTIPQFQAEAQALILWRDQTWLSCYNTLAAVEAGIEPMPESPEALIATLPAAPDRP